MKTLFGLLESTVKRFPTRPIFHTGITSNITYDQFMLDVNKFVCLLQQNGVKKGDHCMIIGDNSPKLGALYYAMFKQGCVAIPSYVKQQSKIKEHMFKETCPHIIFNSSNNSITSQLTSPITYKNFIEINHETIHIDNTYHKYNNINVNPSDLAMILYTSGTSGSPKGVMLTHDNIISNIIAIDNAIGNVSNVTELDKYVSFLPWNHCYGLNCEFNYMIYKGASMYINKDPLQLSKDFTSHNPTILFAVPRLFQMIFQKSPLKNMNFVPTFLSDIMKRKIFGNNIRYATCGGAPIDVELLKYFHMMGLPVFQGYGSTETAPMITLNTLTQNMYGSVGKVLGCNEVKLIDNEIWVSGTNVSCGYYKHDSESFVNSDGKHWYKTGDTGKFDNDYLSITGRTSEIYKLSNGKFVNPSEIENILGRIPEIKQVMIFTTDGISNDALIVSDESETKIHHAINKLKSYVKGYEFPQRLFVIDKPFEQTLLTQKQSFRRKDILNHYSALLKSK